MICFPVAILSPNVTIDVPKDTTNVPPTVISIGRWWSQTSDELNRLIIRRATTQLTRTRSSWRTCRLTAKITSSRLLFAPIETSSSSPGSSSNNPTVALLQLTLFCAPIDQNLNPPTRCIRWRCGRLYYTQGDNDIICCYTLWLVLPTPCCRSTSRKQH